jgi:hypothetical protein
MFEVGQRVVCVDDAPSGSAGRTMFSHATGRIERIEPILDGLKRDQIYTICGFGLSHTGGLGVHLAEIVRPSPIPYRVERFRPVVEPKTSIAVFEAMLHRAPADAVKHLHELAGAP